VLIWFFRLHSACPLCEARRKHHTATPEPDRQALSSQAHGAAQLRATYGLKTADAIQLATAFSEKETAFFTNDTAIVSIPGRQIIVLEKLLAIP
jgi:predicted nucleic acid-binding protein